MRWLILFLLSSCLLFTIVSGVLPNNEQTSPSEWMQLLHLTDCELPCWIGIVPGATTLGEAQMQLRMAYSDTSLYNLVEGEYFSRITHLPTGNQVRIGFFIQDVEVTNASIVQGISLEPGAMTEDEISRPMLSDLEDVLGVPETVRLASGIENPSVILMYQGARINIAVEDLQCDEVRRDQQIRGIGLYEVPPMAAWLSQPQEWVGYDHCYNFERVLS
jgi:hypothetical protein